MVLLGNLYAFQSNVERNGHIHGRTKTDFQTRQVRWLSPPRGQERRHGKDVLVAPVKNRWVKKCAACKCAGECIWTCNSFLVRKKHIYFTWMRQRIIFIFSLYSTRSYIMHITHTAVHIIEWFFPVRKESRRFLHKGCMQTAVDPIELVWVFRFWFR